MPEADGETNGQMGKAKEADTEMEPSILGASLSRVPLSFCFLTAFSLTCVIIARTQTALCCLTSLLIDIFAECHLC